MHIFSGNTKKIMLILLFLIVTLAIVLLLTLSSADRKVIFQKTKKFSYKDTTRSYLQHIPESKPSSIIIAIHEFSGNGRRFAYFTGLHNVVDSETMIVYPEAVKTTNKNELPGWNASFCCGSGWVNKQDDVGYIVALAKSISEQYGISSKNVYLVGFSNGGMLALRTASEHPESFGGVAVSSASMGANNKALKPTAPLPILLMHGKSDVNVPYKGGPGKDPSFVWQSFQETRDVWLAVNKPASPSVGSSLFGGATNYQGENLVRTIETEGSEHTWIGWRIANVWHHKPLMSQEIVNFLDSI